MSTVSFHPTRVIVLSELHSKEKDKYYDLLLSSGAKFHVNESGQFVANIRLLAPGVKKTEARVSKKDTSATNTLPFEERQYILKQQRTRNMMFLSHAKIITKEASIAPISQITQLNTYIKIL